MPYISQEARNELAQGKAPENAGELNYTISRLLLDYLDRQGLSYTRLNEVMGVLSCVGQELYRRLAVPYEDKKIQENGDIF